MHSLARRVGLFGLLCLGCVIAIPFTAGKNRSGQPVYSSTQEALGRLETVGGGRALFRTGNQELTVWDIASRQRVAKLALRGWDEWSNRAPRGLRSEDIFQFQTSKGRLVAVQGPWVVLLDLDRGTEIRRELISDTYLDSNVSVPDRSADLPGGVTLALDPEGGSVAVAFNVGAETGLFIYDANLELKRSLRLARYVRDLCWSPVGGTLAILYAARYDERKRLVSHHLDVLSTEPDVWFLDVTTGKWISKFSTGSSESQILFGSGSKQVYTINTYLYGTYISSPGLIRVFDTASGGLIREIDGPRQGVRGRMEISPDGKSIAADATSQRQNIFGTIINFETTYRVVPRVVALDLGTGRVVFDHHTLIDVFNGWMSELRFGFSSDSRLLLIDLPESGLQGRVSVYPIANR